MDEGFDDDSGAFEAITDALRREATADQRAEARDVVAAGVRDRAFLTQLRRIAPGEVVTVAAADGALVTGRLTAVGLDWIRVLEVADPVGTARARARRLHEIPAHAVLRVTRESE